MKKAVLLTLIIALLFGCNATGMDSDPLSRNTGQPTVRLMYALTKTRMLPYDSTTYYTRLAGWIEGYVEVENIAYEKDVTVHYATGNGIWTNCKAVYVTGTGNNREIWKFKTAETVFLPRWGGVSFDFAVEYRVKNSSYWDNNNNGNYKIACGGVGISRPQMVLNGATLFRETATVAQTQVSLYTSEKIFSGSIVLKNLAYEKNVQIRYTTDNWTTFRQIAAVYHSAITTPTGTSTGYERWKFSVRLPDNATSVKFAASCTQNGQTSWDNNFGRNYTISQ